MKCKRDSDGRKLDHTTWQATRRQEVELVANGVDAKRLAAFAPGGKSQLSQFYSRASGEVRGRKEDVAERGLYAAPCAASETWGRAWRSGQRR